MFRAGLILSILCLTSTATAQSPPVIIYPAGAYTVTTPGPTTVTYTDASVTFSWAVAPTPIPAPPAPTPPAPAPVPVLTGHVWALAIYDPTVALPAAQQAALNSATLKASALLQDVDVQPFKSTDVSVASWLPICPRPVVRRCCSSRGRRAVKASLVTPWRCLAPRPISCPS